MTGVTMEELRELISWEHDAEFTWEGRTYVLQPENRESGRFLVIWIFSPETRYLCSYPIPKRGDIPPDVIDRVLNEKCFDGKSFMEIKDGVTVDYIY